MYDVNLRHGRKKLDDSSKGVVLLKKRVMVFMHQQNLGEL